MELPKEFPLPVAVALAMNIQCFAFGIAVGGLRRKIFNKEFMDKQFGLEHKRQLGQEISKGGYPDTGNGVYSQKLSYKDWYNFNVLQRIHLNYLENINFATGATLAAGLYQPRTAAYIGLTYLIGRFLYGSFYKKKGGAWNTFRIIGSLICALSLAANTGVFATNLYKSLSK